MTIKLIRRLLATIYPVLILLMCLIAWSSSHFAELAALTAPPTGEGFTYYWNPHLPESRSLCGNNTKIESTCSVSAYRSSTLDLAE